MSTNTPTILTLKHYHVTTTVEIPYSDCTMMELFELFRGAVLSAGFHQETYEKVIIELAENFNHEN